jgi:hypothetical protein
MKRTIDLTGAFIEQIALDVQDWAQKCTGGHHECIVAKGLKQLNRGHVLYLFGSHLVQK